MANAQELLNIKLRKVARHGTANDINKALAEGAELNSRDEESGMSALHLAVLYNKRDSINALLARPGITLNVGDEQGFTPLHLAAAMENNRPVVQALIDKGALLEAGDNLGQTPLHRAADKGREDSVRILIDAGANIHAKDKSGRTSRMLAADVHPTGTHDLLKAEEAKHAKQSWTDKAKKGEPPARQ